MQYRVSAIEVADPDANLSKGRERDREPRPQAQTFVQVDGAFCEGQRLFITVTNQRDVGLVAIDRRQHVVGLQQGRHAFSLAQCGIGLVIAPGLGQHDRRQRVHHGEMATIPGGMQGRRGLGDVFAHNRHVADLAVTLAEIEMGEADGAGVMRNLGLLERPVVQRNGARLLTAGKGDAAVQPPEIGMQHLRQGFTNRVWGAAQDRSGLCKIPLQEVRFSQHDANGQLVVAGQRRGCAEQRREQIDRRCRLAAFEGGIGAGDYRLQRCVGHFAQYTKCPKGIIHTAIWS